MYSNIELKMEVGMAKHLVAYDNSLSDLGLKGLSATELDLFMTICMKLKDQKVSEVTLKFSELKKLSGYTYESNKRLRADLDRVNEKLLQLSILMEDEVRQEYVRFAIFDEFGIGISEPVLRVRMKERFIYLLNDLTSNFTELELKEFTDLDSMYSKNLYRQLKRFRRQGWWEVSLEDYRRLLNVPDGRYSSMSNLDKRVTYPSVKELNEKGLFESLKVEKRHLPTRGNPVCGFRFTFKPQPKNRRNKGLEANGLPAQKGVPVPSRYFCPICGYRLYVKSNSNTGFSFYAHLKEDQTEGKAWHDGEGCNSTFNMGYFQPSKKDEEKESQLRRAAALEQHAEMERRMEAQKLEENERYLAEHPDITDYRKRMSAYKDEYEA